MDLNFLKKSKIKILQFVYRPPHNVKGMDTTLKVWTGSTAKK